ncbi:MAG: hypothetical protein M3297_04565 [Thermoproteota archaeon]|nr:hypothetical protein [Thermoproteota archaeon]
MTDLFTPISATIGGLAYLQYQQVASIDWNRMETMASTALGNLTAHISNSQEATTLAMSTLVFH